MVIGNDLLLFARHRQVQHAKPIQMDALTPDGCPESQDADPFEENTVEILVEAIE
jgi:hypothetical protein